MARINYKMMYEALVDRIREQEKYHADREYNFASEDVWDTGMFMHQSKKEECEDLLCYVAGMEKAWAEHVAASGC